MAVWYTGAQPRTIQAMAIGPAAVAPALRLPSGRAVARVANGRAVVTLRGRARPPRASSAPSSECSGRLRGRVLRGDKRVGAGRARLGADCSFRLRVAFPARRLRGRGALRVAVRYRGSLTAGPASRSYGVRVR